MHDAFSVCDAPVVSGLQDRVESLLLYAGRLYIGCQNGSLHIHTLELASDPDNGSPKATLERVIKGFSKKSIEQLGIIKETNSLVSLSNGAVSLHDIHTFEQQTLLGTSSSTKGQANLFALDTSIQSNDKPLASSAVKGKAKEGPSGSRTPVAQRAQRGKDARNASKDPDVTAEPVVVTTLAVACRRRLCLFHWRDGQWQEPKEIPLPHHVRSIAFPLPHSLFLGFSTLEYGTLPLPYVRDPQSRESPTLGELFNTSAPQQSSLSSSTGTTASHTLGALPGLGSLGGLAAKTGGYMGLASKVDKNIVVKVKSNEVLVLRENTGIFLDAAGTSSRSDSLSYALPPEESIVTWPYIVSLLPAPATVGQLSKQQAQDPLTALPSLHIHAAPTLTPVQAIRIPPPAPRPDRPVSILDVPPTPLAQSARLMTTGPSSKSVLAVVTNAATETSTSATFDDKIFLVTPKNWTTQLDQLVAFGKYQEALALLKSLDNADFAVPDAASRVQILTTLVGFCLFVDQKKYEQATDIFIEQNVSPAKVVALFPKAIAGKLHCDREELEEVWGGRTRQQRAQQEQVTQSHTMERKRSMPIPRALGTAEEKAADGQPGDKASSSPTNSSWRFSPMRRREVSKDDDAVSVRSIASKRSMTGLNPAKALRDQTTKEDASQSDKEDLSYNRSVDVLMRYLPDRRQQFLQALASLPPHSRPTPSSPLPDNADTTREALFALPDVPLSSYSAVDLQRVARVVETALFKCYLHAKPGLLGPLCRIENWCEVEEVEELLLDAKKYRELLDLYNGKHMHEKALKLLRRMADDVKEVDAIDDKLDPTVMYVQKLGPDYLELIFSASEWIFPLSPEAGLQIFIADIEEVERLPRHAVSNHLSKVAPSAQYAKYLEHIIHHLKESGPEFHERLIEIYLDQVKEAAPASTAEGQGSKQDVQNVEGFQKLVAFLESSSQYRADRLLGRLGNGDGMDEVRAILLGKLGQHDGALQIYVHKLQDNARAEEYCKRVYEEEYNAHKRSSIFITLLKVYLRPRQDSKSDAADEPKVEAALALLAKYGAKMDANAVLEILPPLLTVQELQTFLCKSMRKAISWQCSAKVLRRVRTARTDEVERALVDLESRRVKITDSRLCPQCHKRLGNSVIAIHSPRGEVTHYQCRDRWLEAKKQRGE